MKIKRILAIVTALAMGAAALTGCGSGTGGDSSPTGTSGDSSVTAGYTATTLNIAIQPSASFIPLYVARELGFMEEAFKAIGVTVNWNDFESGPPMNESLAAGASDVGVLGDVPAVSAIAAGQNNEIIAIASLAGASYGVVVPADSNNTSASDLKGKVIATTIGSTSHEHIDFWLAQEGIDVNNDVRIVNISTGDAASVLTSGEADAVALWEPNITRLVDDGVAKEITDGTDCGLQGVNPIVARADYAEENPEIIEIFLEQYARAIKETASLDDETLRKVADDLSITADQVTKILPKYDFALRISDADAVELQKTIQFLVKIGSINEEYDVKDYIKSKYTENADIAQYLD